MRESWWKSASIGALLTCGVVGAAPPARASDVPVRPGDTIVQGDETCTLGYVYRWAGYTMGLTAGHCAGGSGTRVEDRDAGVHGELVGASAVDRQQDWELIDFGDVLWSQRIRTTRWRMSTLGAVSPGQEICHYGVGSGAVKCGTTLDVRGASIAVSAVGTAGDSGGPCFVLTGTDEVTAVGLWHGHDPEFAGLGFCVSIDAALRAFGERDRPGSAASGSRGSRR